MKSFNAITFKGTLGKDATVRQVGERSVASFSVATEYRTKNAEGEYVSETTWLNVCAWSGWGVCQFDGLVTGAKVSGSGRLRQRKYLDRQENERTVFEVVVDSLDLIQDDRVSPAVAAGKAPRNAQQPRAAETDDPSGDLPF